MKRDAGGAGPYDPAANPLPRPETPTLIDIEQVAIEQAEDAARLVAARYGTAMGVEFKGEAGTDPVTEVDRLIERAGGGGLVLRYDPQRAGWYRLDGFQRAGGNPPAALRVWDEPLLAGGAAVVRELATHLRPRPPDGPHA
jgi:hypothetical protein